MDKQNTRSAAVIMGDLVSSESSLPMDLLHREFNSAVDGQNRDSSAAMLSPLTITLGDEFQGIVKSLTESLKVARALRLKLLKEEIDCRFVIGLVDLKTPINSEKAWNMMGPGLSKARGKLNEKKANQFYRFSILQDPTIEVTLEALGASLSNIERDWTKQQCQDISALLSGMTPTELARERGVSVHSIYKVRNSGNYELYKMLWNAVEVSLLKLDFLEELA